MLEVTLLGTGGMLPLKNRWLTSCLLSCQGHSILVDCGEGTQIALKNTNCKMKPIDLICITHFHADHISGLPGFLLSMGNEGREEPVTIAGPKGIESIVKSICVIAPNLPFELKFEELSDHTKLKSHQLEVTSFRVEHSVECLGYTFDLRRKGRFNAEKAKALNLPVSTWSVLQREGCICYGNQLYTYEAVSDGMQDGVKVTYCTDSRPVKNIVKYASNSDLFICEGLYYEPDKIRRAKKTGHMLYSEAAELAKQSNVKQLWLTHYSPAVTEPEEGLDIAKAVFEHTECGYDGKHIDLLFKNQ